MNEMVATFKATQSRILRRLAEAGPADVASVVEEELRGLYHGIFVMFDGGTPLADEGLVRIVDDDGNEFDRHLHEISCRYWSRP